ncbi:MAG: succinate dehydrogenase, hydrophobic membrane anchor protein [Methylophilaceae bacterium]
MLFELLTKRYPGMRVWLLQRITAVYMAAYLPFIVGYLLLEKPDGYAAWVAFNSPYWLRVLGCLFFLSVCLHAWVGVRDVFRDYVPNMAVRSYLQLFVEIVLLACLAWSVYIFWSI